MTPDSLSTDLHGLSSVNVPDCFRTFAEYVFKDLFFLNLEFFVKN